jgi:hypothetical protein
MAKAPAPKAAPRASSSPAAPKASSTPAAKAPTKAPAPGPKSGVLNTAAAKAAKANPSAGQKTTQSKTASSAKAPGPKSGVLNTAAAKAKANNQSASTKADLARSATRAKNAELKKKTPTAYQKPKGVTPVPPAKKKPAKKPGPKKPPPITTEVEPTPPDIQQGGGDSAPSPTPAVKSAPIDTVVFIDEAFSSELMVDLLFEDIGGQELLTVARTDTVNGQNVVYQPIKNLGILRDTYNPTKLLKLQDTSDKYFANFIINLRDKIPNVGSGENGVNYYLDLATASGVIELINMKIDEQVEIQIASAGIIDEVGI